MNTHALTHIQILIITTLYSKKQWSRNSAHAHTRTYTLTTYTITHAHTHSLQNATCIKGLHHIQTMCTELNTHITHELNNIWAKQCTWIKNHDVFVCVYQCRLIMNCNSAYMCACKMNVCATTFICKIHWSRIVKLQFMAKLQRLMQQHQYDDYTA